MPTEGAVGRFRGDRLDRTFRFGVCAVKTAMTLPQNAAVSVLGRQVVAAAMFPGASPREPNRAETRTPFVNQVAIALKECREAVRRLDRVVGAGIVARPGMEPLAAGGGRDREDPCDDCAQGEIEDEGVDRARIRFR